MSKFIYSAILAVALFAGAAPAFASTAWTDTSRPDGGFSPDSPEGIQAFWDYQTRHGG